MIEQINIIAQGWWNWMWPMFWQVSILVIFLGAIDILLRRHVWPQVRYALWLLVLIKLILPPTFSLSTSIISQARIQTDRMATQLIATNSQADFPSIRLSSERNAYLTDTGIEPFIAPDTIMTNVPYEPRVKIDSSNIAGSGIDVKLHWRSYTMVVWLIVMVTLSLWVVIRFRKLRKFYTGKFRGADLPHWFRPLLVKTAEKLGLRKLPEIALSRNVSSPAVFGVFRPVLVLPATAIHRLSQKHTEHILLHELAHIKRGDLLVNTFYILLQLIYWFNPILWLLRRRLQHLRELCCDATVARILRDKTVDYRETILIVTQRYLAKPFGPGIGLLGMTETSSRLLVRLKWLEKRTWKYRGIRIATICIVIALMSICVLPMAKAGNAGVLIVAADGNAKYSSIQEAIDAADEGAEIRIGPGMYEERLRISKPLTLTGAGWEQTTIMTKNTAGEKYETTMMKLSVRAADRLKQDNSKQQQNAIMEEFTSEYGKEHATVLVTDTEGVAIRGLKFTSPGKILKERLLPVPVIKFSGANAEMSDCVIIDSPGIGIEVAGDSDVEIRKCLVAAVWNTGILVKAGQSSPKTLISETDVRNCYHVGIVIRPACDSTVVERCRISGSAWHGIRYDHTSPTITNNLLYSNARCGIYASGETEAAIRENLFYSNEMAGMSCWFKNRDTIEGNTFVSNERSGLEILGTSTPKVRRNIFSKNPIGISRGNINSNSQSAQSAGEILLEENIFWNNQKATENTTLGEANKLDVDPLFTDVDGGEYSLKVNSPARHAQIGVPDPIYFKSRWALQPQEKAIIPDSDTRDFRQWKEPMLYEPDGISQGNKPEVSIEATKTGTSEDKQDFEQLLDEYRMLVTQLDKEMKAYRASTPVFAKFLDVIATEGPKLNQARKDAEARLGEARKSGIDLKSLKYDEKASEIVIKGILAGMFREIYSEFQKALEAGKLRLPDEQQTIYYRGGYFVTQTTEPLSGQWHEHSSYDQGTLEYCQFVSQLTYTATMLLSPLVKMAEQVPEVLQVKKQRIDELYGRLEQLKRKSKSNVVLDLKYEDPYMMKLKASAEKQPGISRTRNFETNPVNPSDIALLYHSDPDVRIETVKMIAESNDSGLIDDLIRANSVENYTPVHNEYGQVLQSLTRNRNVRGKGAWKAWLASEAEAGRMKIEYLPIEPAADVQGEILAFALVRQDGFNEMTAALTAAAYDRHKCLDALRYMVFNDHLVHVRKFLSGDWLSSLFAHREININDIGYFLNGLANPGPLRKQVDTQIRNCLDSGNPIVVANALTLIAGVEGYSTRFIVPDVEDKITGLTSSSVPEIAKQAQRALERITPREKRPGDVKAASTPMTSLESRSVVNDLPGELIFHGRYKHRSGGRDYGEPGELWLKQDQDGSITAVADLAFMATTTIASSDKNNRLVRYKDKSSPTGRPGYSIDLELLDGKVLLTRRGLRQDCDGKELIVPEGVLFNPNARPDSYCAANILLRGFDLEKGQSKELRVYDWDNSGEAMADYTIRIEHTGTESVEVPAGIFEANHIVLTQVTSADTWFKKRAGHVTDFWVLDNGVIVRILRHREPYEIQLLDYTTPAELPGKSADFGANRTNTSRDVSYKEAFLDLHKVLGEQYPCFRLKEIDWNYIGKQFLSRIEDVKDDNQFGLLCMELVAKLQDSHATLLEGTAKLPDLPMPQWDPGFASLEDDNGRPAVYYVDKNGPAEKAGVKVGMIVLSIDGQDATEAIKRTMAQLSQYIGYSSRRYLQYHAYRFFIRSIDRGAIVKLKMLDPKGKTYDFEIPANLQYRYLPRLPVPRAGIRDSADVSWKMLDDNIGYIYVRRIRNDLISSLDKATAELMDADGIIVDVRGNSGGGFDSRRAHLNFALDMDSQEPQRPHYKDPMALLIDSRCISAGEGWASWFVANKRATLFGETTAGASARKTIYELKNGLYKVNFPVKAYTGYLDRAIERRGIEPDVPIRQNTKDLAEGRDTVLEAAKKYLLEHVKK